MYRFFKFSDGLNLILVCSFVPAAAAAAAAAEHISPASHTPLPQIPEGWTWKSGAMANSGVEVESAPACGRWRKKAERAEGR